MMYASAIKEVEKMLDDLEEYSRTEYKVEEPKDVMYMDDRTCTRHSLNCQSVNYSCHCEKEMNSFRNTKRNLEVMMQELKLMSCALKEFVYSIISDDRGKRGETMGSDMMYEDIPSLEHFIDNMTNKLRRDETKNEDKMEAPSTNMILLYERMISNLQSEVSYLRELNTTSGSMYKEEIRNLKEDLNVKNNFIRSLLSGPVSRSSIASRNFHQAGAFRCSTEDEVITKRIISQRIGGTANSFRSSHNTVDNMRTKRKNRVTSVDRLDASELEMLSKLLP